MSDTPRARRPRPVADAPVSALTERAEALAKGWLIALVERRPLAEAAHVPARELGRDGPALVAALARSLASDDDLTAFLEVEGRTVGRLAGAKDPAAVAEAVEALRGVVWAATLDALADPTPQQLGEIADRLAHIANRLVARSAAARPRAPGEEAVRAARGTLYAEERPAQEPGPVAEGPAPHEEAGPVERPLHAVPSPPRQGGAPLWLSALEQRLGRGERPGERTSLLLVELDGIDRLRASIENGAEDLIAGASREIRRAVRREDLVAHEDDGRTWILATDTGRFAAETLARRIAESVSRAAAPHGAPLTASIGLAVHPEDGSDAGSLASYAEEEMLAARAAGVRMLGDSTV